MATTKTYTNTQQYAAGATSPSAVSFTAEQTVLNGVLSADPKVVQPGVFTAGTPVEGSASNPSNDVNA